MDEVAEGLSMVLQCKTNTAAHCLKDFDDERTCLASAVARPPRQLQPTKTETSAPLTAYGKTAASGIYASSNEREVTMVS